MKVLVACEFSGTVREAFRRRGHDAWSCDLLPTEIPGNHIQGDASTILNAGWDLIIAHPPCTYLCVPGAHYLHKQNDRWGKMLSAREFFLLCLNANTKKLCVENPLPHRYAELPKYSQIINPWQFGQEFSKRTCLWIKGLPLLMPTKIVSKGERYTRKDGTTSNSKWYAKASQKERSKTFQGIADAMASQWG
ncbi:MAG TPA: hypothetical protein PK522_00800 [Nitrosomonas sp.]|nr:hypothetical protein [Nitrosomonas sp.]